MDNLADLTQDEHLNIRDLLAKYIVYWPWFLVSLTFCIGVAYFINRFSTPIYQVHTSILVEDEKSMLDERFKTASGISDNTYKLSNEIEILKSYSIIRKTIKQLNFNIAYFESGKFNDKEIYKQSPFSIVLDSTLLFPFYTPIYIEIISPKQFAIHTNSQDVYLYDLKTEEAKHPLHNFNIDTTGTFFQPFHRNNIGFTIIPEAHINLSNYIGKQYYFIVYDQNSLIQQFRGLSIATVKTSSVLNVSLNGTNVLKLVDFLNTFTNVYLVRGLEKKYRMAENTIKFINAQLNEVSDSLFFSEQTLQDYRSDNQVIDVGFQAQQVYTMLENLKTERAQIVLKNKYYEYLEQFLKDDNDGKNLIAPSALGIQNEAISNLINVLIEQYVERSELALNSKRNNPLLLANEQRIKSLKTSVFQNIKTLINTSKISLQDIDRRIDEIASRGNRLPETQRKLIGFERKFKLNDALYTYLLTKRSETQISKASYIPNNEVIDEATLQNYSQVAPRTRHNFILALLIGLAFPAIILMLRDYLNNKIQSTEDIEAITNYPILGHVIHSREKSKTVINDYPMSQTSESIRAIRTNFQFIAKEGDSNVIIMSSSIMSEGKTFITANLALSFALIKKKTVVLNFDMRRPKLQDYLNIKTEKGLSSYLSGNAKLEDIILHTDFENLDVIMAGDIPPNPMELLASEYTNNLFQALKQTYNYIIVDTPPVGMVADALLLIKYSDVNIFVVRHNYTHKKMLDKLTQNLHKREIQKVHVILNDVYLQRSYGYGYNYNYGYGYTNKPTFVSNLKKIAVFLHL